MSRHPEAREESDGELEHEGRNVGREGQVGNMLIEYKIAEVEHLSMEDKMVEDIVQHPLQNQIESATSRITEQLKAHELAEGWIEEVNDFGQSAFYP